MDQPIIKAIRDSGAFTDEDLQALIEGERAHGPVVNWPEATFREVLEHPATAILARQTVALAKVGAVTEAQTQIVLPDFPPYLEREADGKPAGYDPRDPSQYWTDPDTGERWRWDGKGRGRQYLSDRWPNGQPHRVAIVAHRRSAEGVMIPDEQQSLDANNSGHDWFHQGYNVWVGNGGKPYGEVTLPMRQRFRLAKQQMPQTDAPLVLRSPRLAAY